ncbi:MAG: ABC transporter ATP-binding protein [Euzebyales bacterium]|nr:ABC transporter ATP-binding protein [Euzebyales bacterium]
MSEVPIHVRGVVKSFGETRAVDGVDLDVTRGRIVALLGPSGCGKTTMLRLIAGFEHPDAGEITIDGRIVAGNGRFVAPDRRRIGMVFQDYALFPHLDVAGNVGFGLPRRGRDRAEALDGVLELVGLAGLEHRFPHELSGGQQQRVALARALAPQPAVILLDEPFSNLDAALRAQVRSDVHRILTAADATAVFVTHDQEEALSLADEVAVMHAGRIAQLAAPERLYHEPADRLVAAFVGEAEFWAGDSTGDVVHTELGALALREEARGGVDVLVRPEEIRLTKDARGTAHVVAREFYGHDQVLIVRLEGGRRVRVRLGPVTDLTPGDRCHVTIDGPVRAFPRA